MIWMMEKRNIVKFLENNFEVWNIETYLSNFVLLMVSIVILYA
jgi:isocitrate dehydrogenase